jgi:hypothetical protein
MVGFFFVWNFLDIYFLQDLHYTHNLADAQHRYDQSAITMLPTLHIAIAVLPHIISTVRYKANDISLAADRIPYHAYSRVVMFSSKDIFIAKSRFKTT